MEVKPGYKQTEVGVIPEDWEVTRIGNIAAVEGGYAFSSKTFLRSGTYQVVKMSNLFGGSLDLDRSASFLDELDEQEKYYLLRPAEILITLTGTIGKRDYGYSHKIDHEQNLLLNQRVARLIVGESANPSYVDSQIKMPCFLDQFFDVSKGGTGNQANVGTGDLAAIQIPLPPLHEQRAIAEALSDADALIESLEQLVTKKRQLKQGAMQELLTGKRRLPGFSGDWEIRRLGEMLTICHGKSQREVEATDGLYPILATGGKIGRANHFLYDKPSVLIGRKGTIDQPQYMDTPFWTVDTLFYSVVHEPNHAKFIFYRFCLVDWKQHNEASGVPSLNARTIEMIEINSPGPEEQTAIAAILSDMDAEIAALDANVTKARSIKQGMMQELLTGRIRLV